MILTNYLYSYLYSSSLIFEFKKFSLGFEKLIFVLSCEQTLNYSNGCQILWLRFWRWNMPGRSLVECLRRPLKTLNLSIVLRLGRLSNGSTPSPTWGSRPGRPPLKETTGTLRTILVSSTIFPNPEFFVSENFTISPRRVNFLLLDTLMLWL